MTKTLPITEARQKFPTLVDRASKMLDEYESWRETEEIMADKALMKAIRQGEKEIEEGKGIPWEQVKKDLGLD